jgi:hypothetical protein
MPASVLERLSKPAGATARTVSRAAGQAENNRQQAEAASPASPPLAESGSSSKGGAAPPAGSTGNGAESSSGGSNDGAGGAGDASGADGGGSSSSGAPGQHGAIYQAAEKVITPVLTSAPMQAVGRVFNLFTSIEMAASAPLGKIPFPSFPAVTVGAFGFGFPHAHGHPPNTPPIPPIPLPHATKLIPIPILSGAMNTFVANKPATRCGDMGISVFCGGWFPLNEIRINPVVLTSARAKRIEWSSSRTCTRSA